jgi:hypothetical protein
VELELLDEVEETLLEDEDDELLLDEDEETLLEDEDDELLLDEDEETLLEDEDDELLLDDEDEETLLEDEDDELLLDDEDEETLLEDEDDELLLDDEDEELDELLLDEDEELLDDEVALLTVVAVVDVVVVPPGPPRRQAHSLVAPGGWQKPGQAESPLGAVTSHCSLASRMPSPQVNGQQCPWLPKSLPMLSPTKWPSSSLPCPSFRWPVSVHASRMKVPFQPNAMSPFSATRRSMPQPLPMSALLLMRTFPWPGIRRVAGAVLSTWTFLPALTLQKTKVPPARFSCPPSWTISAP